MNEQSKDVWATTGDGVRYRDLNGNGVMDPYEDPRLDVDARVDDLLGRLSLEEKVGLMFHTVIEAGADGTVVEAAGAISKSPTSVVVLEKHLNHFNVHALDDPRMAARWHNALQALAERSPHGIPVTISTDPRHAFIENAGVSFTAKSFSQWPEPLGLAALRDADAVREFADIARQEYVAVGIRAALHPTLDLATEPRWARQAGTFGQDPALVTELGTAYLEGFQQKVLGPDSVACTSKHFPGGGPQQDGEDAHFPYGREQVYPGGRFADHLAPFPAAIEAGTAAVMPYYGMPVGLEVDGEPIEQVGFGYNAQVVTGLLREQLGYDGVVLTDWELVNDNHVGDQVLPARAWGVEHLDPHERMERILAAGADQFGGEECVEVLLDLVAQGRVPEARIDESARRLLAVKFRLGLFDDPYVDEDAAAAHRRPRRLPGRGVRGAGPLGHRAHQRALGCRPGPPARGRPAHLRRERAARGGGAARHPGGASGGRRRGAGAAERAVRAALGPVPRVVVPRRARSTSRPGWSCGCSGSPRTARSSSTSRSTGRRCSPRCCRWPPPWWRATARATTPCSRRSPARIMPRGRLPFDLPRSMDQVRAHPEDVPGYDDPLFPFGHGLTL